MLIDAALLRRAPIEALERLATSLAIDLPAARRKARRECVAWHHALVLVLSARIRRDAARDELARSLGPAAAQPNIVDVLRGEVEVTDE